jgi:nitroreductase
MEFDELVRTNRSYRRFNERRPLDAETLIGLVGLARNTPSAMNRQPLKYVVSCGARSNAKVFDTLAWAGSLKDWDGPEPGERPTGYIVVLVDKELNPSAATDIGIAAQTILLGAVDRGLGGCMLGAIRRPALREALSLPDHLEIGLVIALGEPVERVVLEDAAPGGSTTYYRDPDSTHHVPKRTLTEIIIARHEE